MKLPASGRQGESGKNVSKNLIEPVICRVGATGRAENALDLSARRQSSRGTGILQQKFDILEFID